ncbi:taurine ABC transporter ATP-binding protein [Aquamicrobium sp. NLF2-7]|uniref:taurine ABC transporter ATP-binding protein n=1 Tax=Aquamicrobium sp. NLF2-7 TaxID=2918753 RepID=UPI001EFB9D60|nr:taurine ABC transporter ATP-binding protein [Aquamicrobium sp. NLF2-7]MCG8273701.1 taurine ABC transporter ATP-binding protein [Aquamicrobium sp. NLF2-7]
MPQLSLDDITIHYDGQPHVAVAQTSLAVATGEFVVLTGRSGCGKTSLLNVAAGLVEPLSGSATIDGRPITAPGADRAVVFQNDALFPWLSVRENVAFALRMRGVAPGRRQAQADALLRKVRLDNSGDKRIWELSGGMRQRVGLARALAAEPDFLLMDEPLGALDALTRERMQSLLLDIWASAEAGVLMVTHGIEEALLLGTRIVVMAPGPGRIVWSREAAFGRRYADGEPIASIKADPEFIAARAELSAAIFEGETA